MTGARSTTPAGAPWLVAAACVLFVICLAAVAFDPPGETRSTAGASALSRSPVGYAGLVDLLRADGAEVRLSRRRESAEGGGDTLLVLTPAPDSSASEIARLSAGRRVLIVPPKWTIAPYPHAPSRVMRGPLLPSAIAGGQIKAALSARAGDTSPTVAQDTTWAPRRLLLSQPNGAHDWLATPVVLPAIADLRTLAGSPPVLVDPQGRALAVIARDRVAYAIADPDLINNQAMRTLAGAHASVAVLEGMADGAPIIFDLTLPGAVSAPHPLRLFFKPPLVQAFAGALGLAVLSGLMARGRFGALEEAPLGYAFGKKALVDSIASLLIAAGRGRGVLERYLQDAAPAAAEERSVAAADGGSNPGRLEEWRVIAADALRARSSAQQLTVARQAHAWKSEGASGQR